MESNENGGCVKMSWIVLRCVSDQTTDERCVICGKGSIPSTPSVVFKDEICALGPDSWRLYILDATLILVAT